MRGREGDLQSAEGVIIKGVGGLYYARGEDGGTHVLRARGIFRRRHITPMVGDRVRFTPGQGEEHGWVEEILPRESQLVRPPVANVRYLVIVLAPAPAPDYLLIDTLIAMALRQGIRPALVVNKCDLDGGTYEAVRSDYAGLGAPLLAVSALSGPGDGRPAVPACIGRLLPGGAERRGQEHVALRCHGSQAADRRNQPEDPPGQAHHPPCGAAIQRGVPGAGHAGIQPAGIVGGAGAHPAEGVLSRIRSL